MSEIDYLIRDLEQRRSVIIQELQRIKTQPSEMDSSSNELKERIKRLEGQRAWLNRSIEKLIYQ